jgi:hypothetical protein
MLPCVSSTLTPAMIASHHCNAKKFDGPGTVRDAAWLRIKPLRNGRHFGQAEGTEESVKSVDSSCIRNGAGISKEPLCHDVIDYKGC